MIVIHIDRLLYGIFGAILLGATGTALFYVIADWLHTRRGRGK